MERAKLYTVSKDFANRSSGLEDWEEVQEKTYHSSTSVTILEIFPEQLVARIYHPIYSPDKKTCIPYSPDSGIVSGSTARVDIHSGAPLITRILKHGVETKKSYVINIDPTAKEKIKKGDAPKYGDYKNIAFDKYIFLAKEGEKVYSAGKSAILLGFEHVVISNKGDAELILRAGVAEIKGKTASLFSDYASISTNTTSLSGAYISSSVDKIETEYSEGKKPDPIYREYRGSCNIGLEDDGITIESIPNGAPDMSSVVYLDIVLNPDIENFSLETGKISSSFRNRKLKVIGDRKDLPIHEELNGYASIEFNKYSAGIASFNDKKYAIVFFKAITKNGDTILFQSGKKSTLSLKEDISVSVDKTDVTLENKTIINQENVSEIHLPTSENSFYIQDRYHSQMISNFCKVSQKDYVETYNSKINTFVKYEIDAESGIQTRETHNSPLYYYNGTSMFISLEESQFKPEYSFIIKDKSGNSISTSRTLDEDSKETVTFSFGSKRSFKSFGTKAYVVDGLDSSTFNTKKAFFNGGITIKSKLNVGDGIFTKGNLIVDAKTVQIKADSSLSFLSEGTIYASGSLVYLKSDGKLALSGTAKTYNDSTKNTVAPMLIISDEQIQLYGESLSLIGKKRANLQSELFVGLSAKNISVPGYKKW